MNGDEFLALFPPTPPLKVDLGDGKTIYVRSCSMREADRVKELTEQYGCSTIAAWVTIAACDESGKRIFKDAQAGAVDQLPMGIARKICEAALAHNGLGDEEPDGPLARQSGSNTRSASRWGSGLRATSDKSSPAETCLDGDGITNASPSANSEPTSAHQ